MSYPTQRPTGLEGGDGMGAVPAELNNVPWIDIHNHAHTLSWNDRERFALSGCEAMVMMGAAYYWTPYKPVAPEDVRYLWDDALNRLPQIRESHLVDAKVGVGIHTGARVENYDELLDVLPEYAALDEVAAIGEIGITEAQHVAGWSLDEQKDVTREQFAVAADHDLPAVVHTPADLSDVEFPERISGNVPGYELDLAREQEPVLSSDYPKREAVEIDVALADQAGLPQEQVVLSHMDARIAPYVLEHTDCWLSFTVSYPWLLGVSPADVAEIVAEYGPERIMVETDSAGVLRSDVFSFKRTIHEMYRMGVDVDDIRQVVYENPQSVLP